MSPYQAVFNLLLIIYSLSAAAYLFFFFTRNKRFALTGFYSAWSGLALHAALIFYRSLVCGAFAVSSLYESLSFFAWVIVLVYLIFERKRRFWTDGTFVMPLVVSLMAYASVMNSGIRPMPPALNSPWLVVHVALCFLSYACFTLAFCFALMYLWQEKELKSRKVDLFFFRLPPLGTLDRLGYKTVVLGFLFLTLGIVSGSVWAQNAWGAFWSWDPKETSSLVMWLLYLVYLHCRLILGWKGKKSAYLAAAGFAVMLFTYLGVSFLLPGVHSYLK